MLSRVLCAGAAIALCSCSRDYTLHVASSAGSSWRASGTMGQVRTRSYLRLNDAVDDAYAQATEDSAAYDLACPSASVRVVSVRAPHFVAEGCGQRAVYECPLRDTPSSSPGDYEAECRMVLVNRFSMQRGPAPHPDDTARAE